MLKRMWVAVLILLTFTGCDGLLSEGDDCRNDPETTSQIARFQLPPEYTNFESRCDRWMDHITVDARFEMSPEHLEEFQAGTQITEWQTGIDSGKIERLKLLDERTFNAMTDYLYGETGDQILASGTQQILIDTGSPQQYIVYLTYFVSY